MKNWKEFRGVKKSLEEHLYILEIIVKLSKNVCLCI